MYCLFFSFSFCVYHSERAKLRYLLAFTSNIFTSKNVCWPLTQNLLDLVSSVVRVFVALFEKLSPVTGSSFGLISTLLHTWLSKFAVMPPKSLCQLSTSDFTYEPLQSSLRIVAPKCYFPSVVILTTLPLNVSIAFSKYCSLITK